MEIPDILALQDSIMNDPDLQPRDGSTFCNFGVQKFLTKGYGYMKMNGLTADEMFEYMASHFLEWQKLQDAEHAKQRADLGDATIAAHPYAGHGHVAMVRPNCPLGHSGQWGIDCAALSNVGKTNGLMLANFAFPVHDTPPTYFRLCV